MINMRHTFLGIASLLLNTVNLTMIQNPILGALCAFGFMWSITKLFSSRLHQDGFKNEQLIIGFLLGLSILMIGGSIIYYIGTVTTLSLTTLLVIVLLIASLSSKKLKIAKLKTDKPLLVGASIIILLSLATWWSYLLKIEIVDSIRSPWEIISPQILILMLIAIILIIAMISKSISNLTTTLFILIFGSSLMIAVTIYIYGYGFDPFIHRATIEYIAEHGTITPKPMYYIGQYAIELMGTLIFSLPIKLTDTLLAPLSASILIPLSAIASIKILGLNWRMLLPALFLLPLGSFINTTPQSFAYVLTICLVILSLPLLMNKIKSKTYLSFLGILTLAILITHPLAGIPSFFYFIFIFIDRINIKQIIKNALILATIVLSAISLPLIFILQAIQSNLDIKFSVSDISLSQLNLTSFFSNNFNTWLDGSYLIINNHLWIVLLFTLIGVIFIRIEKLPKGIYSGLYAGFASLLSYAILTLTLNFNFLIEYEQSNYADRLLIIAIIFLIPYVGIAFSSIWSRIENKSIILKFSYTFIIAIIATSTIYGAYPRHDNYARSSGFNVSQADFDAVYEIEEYAGETEYIVLANQATSSAALEAFGFAHYYKSDIFYYPIPTGGPMYNFFLKMTDDKPTAETMNQAMNFAGVELGFFVVSNYWWESDRIIDHAKTEAVDWFALDDGSVTVFIFEIK